MASVYFNDCEKKKVALFSSGFFFVCQKKATLEAKARFFLFLSKEFVCLMIARKKKVFFFFCLICFVLFWKRSDNLFQSSRLSSKPRFEKERKSSLQTLFTPKQNKWDLPFFFNFQVNSLPQAKLYRVGTKKRAKDF